MERINFLSEKIRQNAKNSFEKLPVFEHLENIADNLKNSPSQSLVLTAETGAGKSTAVPFGLLNSFGGKVLMLEPRRLAVLSLAKYASEIADEQLGSFAGYRMHLDSKVTKETQLEIVTEAVALRLIQNDPSLEGYSVVIIDEFHERSVYVDLFLAFLKEAKELRDDLFLLVMSATIETKKLCEYLNCGLYSVPGRLFPVEIEYKQTEIENAVMHELENPCNSGSILVFLPGIKDIKRAEQKLKEKLENTENVEICLLHSSVSFEEQKHVLTMPEKGTRRVILSSSIAETSLTVPDISTVIDSGLARINRFEPRTGMNRLVTESECEFSATQRAGRAGRTQKGRCVRMWHKTDLRLKSLPVEILRSDITFLVLECDLLGALRRDSIDLLDLPPLGAWNQACEFLQKAELIEKDEDGGSITSKGKLVLSFGIHPRLGAVAASAAFSGNLKNALDYVIKYSGENSAERAGKLYANLEKKIKAFEVPLDLKNAEPSELNGANVLLCGFFDRVARREDGIIYQLYSGKKAALCADLQKKFQETGFPEYIIAIDADSGEKQGCIYQAEKLENVENWLKMHSTEEIHVYFEETKSARKVRKARRKLYGRILLSEELLAVEPSDTAKAYVSFFRENGIESFPWNKASLNFYERARFYAKHSLEEKTDDLLENLEEWLLPFWHGSSMISEENFLEALRYKFDGRSVDSAVPLRLKLENGREVQVKYEEIDKSAGPVPVIEIIIQQIFGCKKTPAVCGVPVLFRLLSPARRPLQVTQDLEGFWKNTWPEICKEMKGRYPKHNWDPDKVCD
ncbi:MAG: ATP-dependent helicase HrpB [Treponemataceae bacterium]|nr:ATP-dependent helicase HrpB [Treponemataceae bacterium]